jgi:hypothetical protein
MVDGILKKTHVHYYRNDFHVRSDSHLQERAENPLLAVAFRKSSPRASSAPAPGNAFLGEGLKLHPFLKILFSLNFWCQILSSHIY